MCGPLQLSPDCQDLLTRIFHINEDERITVAEIEEHPWFRAPLSQRYAEAESKMITCQAAIDRHKASHPVDEVCCCPTRRLEMSVSIIAVSGFSVCGYCAVPSVGEGGHFD